MKPAEHWMWSQNPRHTVDVRMLDDGALRFIGARGQRLEPVVNMVEETARLVCEHRIKGIGTPASASLV
ncbi:MAG: hypothetical protein H0T52_03685 [Lautropia sp.]|nr:hypothetical protein [Lautropia sp.]